MVRYGKLADATDDIPSIRTQSCLAYSAQRIGSIDHIWRLPKQAEGLPMKSIGRTIETILVLIAGVVLLGVVMWLPFSGAARTMLVFGTVVHVFLRLRRVP